jgi:methylornithine synthase
MSQKRINDLEWVQQIVDRALNLEAPQADELAKLLGLTPSETEAAEIVFDGSRKLRGRYFGQDIFLYGFVYLSTFCHNDCSFCNYRQSNHRLERYRKDLGLVIDTSMELAEGGVNLIDLTLGEDEVYLTGSGFERLLKSVETIAKYSRLPIMLSPGVLDNTRLNEAASAGVSWYALYQETHNRDLFPLLRRRQDYDLRLGAKAKARENGLLIEDGVLVGVGASDSDLANSIKAMGEAGACQVRAMAYVPVPDGLKADPAIDRSWQELMMIACLRLVYPASLIPASLDVDGLAGLSARLGAGANVVTSIVPPGKGLAGVASMTLDIGNRNRNADTVIDRLREMSLNPASTDGYLAFVESARKTEDVLP